MSVNKNIVIMCSLLNRFNDYHNFQVLMSVNTICRYFFIAVSDLKISMIHIVEDVTSTANITVVCCLTFIVEENAKEMLNFS